MAGSQRSVRHAAAPHRGRRVLIALATALGLVVVVAGAGAAVVWHRLQGNITAKDVIRQLGPDRPTAPAPKPGQDQPAENILVMGSDTRAGDNAVYGSGIQGARSDTVVLVHLAAGRTRADLVSIPRDSVVDIPECYLDDGKVLPPTRNRFNDAYSRGGPACSIRTVEQLTQIRIDHYVVVDFNGFRGMVDAIHGVTVCVPHAVHDDIGHIDLPAGTYSVDGEQALNYVRERHGFGDGSDIGRMKRQQAFIAAMINKVVSAGTLANPVRLYNFLNAATGSLTTDPDFAHLRDLVSLGLSLKNIGLDRIRFITVPWQPWPQDPNRIEWASSARKLWHRIKYDEPLKGQLASGALSAAQTPGSKPSGKPGGKSTPNGTPSGSPSPSEQQKAQAEAYGLCA